MGKGEERAKLGTRKALPLPRRLHRKQRFELAIGRWRTIQSRLKLLEMLWVEDKEPLIQENIHGALPRALDDEFAA